MTIRALVTYCAGALMAILLICVGVGTVRINEIRMGGPIQTTAQQASDLIADILPPPEYVIEPYLEATMIVQNPATVQAHVERLTKLRADYDTRHSYWTSVDLDPRVKDSIVSGTHESASRFWSELEDRLIPSAQSGDLEAMNASYATLSAIYLEHRGAVDDAVKLATDYKASLDRKASERLSSSMLLLGGLAMLLLIGCAGFAAVVLLRVVRPIRQITSHMQVMATGGAYDAAEDAHRSDEIGDVARALQGIVHYVEATARETSEMEMAKQQHIVAALGRGLSQLKDGVLSHRISERFPEDYEKLRQDYNTTAHAMQSVIGQVMQAVESLNSSAGEISAATQDLSQRTEQQAASLEETAAAMHQLTDRVKDTAEAATQASSSVHHAEEAASSNASVVRSAVEAMGGIESSAQGIARITNVIDDLAFQTNLLSLNASVEAARAGEAGKSFAVVAEEVRALAQRSATAAKDIKVLIDESTRQVEGGVRLVGQTGEALEGIMSRVSDVSGLITRIACAAGEQAEGVAQINSAMGGMDRMTQQNAAMGEECNAAARMLHQEADRLTALISRFQLGQLSDEADGDALHPSDWQEAA